MPEHRPLPAELRTLAKTQRGALAGTQVRAALGERGLRRALVSRQLIKLWQGAYAVPSLPASELTESRASALPSSGENALPSASAANPPGSLPPAVTADNVPVITRLAAAELTLRRPITACLHTAAEIYGFAIDPDSRTHVVGTTPSQRDEVAVHRTPPLDPTNRAYGFGVVGAAETAVRLAALAPNAPRSLAVLDAALRTNYTSATLLNENAERMHIAGVRRVRSLITLADRRAESPPESWLRWVCHDAGLPPVVPQYWVQCANETWFRLDLAWPSIKLGLEFDGIGVHTGTALTRDRKRLSALTRAGWTIHSVTAPMLWTGRAELVAELRADLRLRGAL